MTDKKKKILVIEDEVPVRTALVDEFKGEGFEVLEAGDGEEGLRLALSSKPDLILLDIVMPKMDGMAMLQAMREHKGYEDIPVLVLTNLSDTRSITEATKGAAFGYLIKSNWKLDEVTKKVKEALKSQDKS